MAHAHTIFAITLGRDCLQTCDQYARLTSNPARLDQSLSPALNTPKDTQEVADSEFDCRAMANRLQAIWRAGSALPQSSNQRTDKGNCDSMGDVGLIYHYYQKQYKDDSVRHDFVRVITVLGVVPGGAYCPRALARQLVNIAMHRA